MIYAGTKDTIKKALQGLQVEIQGTDKSEVDYNEVLTKCQAVSK
jgi:cofilin